ncbi:phospholipase D family protein [Pseudohalioglobus sediminis]|uniref:Phospholipase D family protein n=1 Tax=Pseudohalioglobus sediminis TaxID=2606449 RepID=A0A5B0WQV4_9GAMM|nr:phospholipase D family protein [Pseudohalioglobus sediminis]KAA1189470.1 phospholipase D family protein [Pseudohalioglobus sediminis]
MRSIIISDAIGCLPHRSLQRLAVLGLALFLTACGTLPQNVDKVASQAPPPSNESGLVRAIQPMLEQHPQQSGFRLLAQGEQAYAARLRLVAAAQKTLDAQYYIWHEDLTGIVLQNMFLKAADRGVRVRLLLDDLDTAGKDERLREMNAHPNIQIRVFNPFANRDFRAGDFLVDTRRVNHRMHNKTLTADNIATIVGGRNIGDEYFGATEAVAFGDLDSLGIGPVAQQVSSQFDLYWNSEYVYPLESFKWKTEITEADVADYRRWSDNYVEQAKQTRYAEILNQVEFAQIKHISELEFVWSDWVLAYDHPQAIEMKEMTQETHLALKILKGMEDAQRDLIIVSPYFVPGEKFTAFLSDIEKRGVRVRILTNSLQANDVSMVHAGYMRYREDLINAGVELYEYHASSNKVRRRLQRERIDVAKTSLHAKFFVVDEAEIFVGSFNLDGRSARLNTELGVYYASPEQAGRLSEKFEAVMEQLAYRVIINDAGDLEWVGQNPDTGEEVRLSHEPDTTWWKRTSTRILSWFVPESQL